jgi:putative transposase
MGEPSDKGNDGLPGMGEPSDTGNDGLPGTDNPSYGCGTFWGMADYRRWRVAGGTYFFTLVTEGRARFLCDEPARRCLREAIRVVRRKRPFRIDAIVLLPDHLHAVWSLPEGESDYSTRWQLIKRRFTREYLKTGGVEAVRSASRLAKGERSVWQRRFFEHTVRDEADMKRCVDYVHVNPLKHGLVARVREWPWSSFHRYVRLGEYSIDWGDASVWYGDEWKDYE